MFIEGIRHLKENSLRHGAIEFLLTCAEEVGLCGIKGFDLSVLDSRMAFVYDSDGPVGKIIIRAPYDMNFTVKIKGRAAHAGMEPEKGINAIKILSEIITSLPTGRIDEETTMNVGVITGGRATNIVPEDAECRLEIRSIDKMKLGYYQKQMKDTVKKTASQYGARSTVHERVDYTGYSLSPGEKIVAVAERAIKNLGIRPRLLSTGGGSDTNVFNRFGIKAVNLSCGMRNVHTKKEYINIRDLLNGTRLMLEIISVNTGM